MKTDGVVDGNRENENDTLWELEKLLDSRIQSANAGVVSRTTPSQVFAPAIRSRVN